MEGYAGRSALAEGPYFRHGLTMSESERRSWNLPAACPHTCFVAGGPVSQHPALAWGRRGASQLLGTTEEFRAMNWSQHRAAQAAEAAFVLPAVGLGSLEAAPSHCSPDGAEPGV